MTRYLLFTCFAILGFSKPLFSNAQLPAHTGASLLTHLQHVNAQWAAQAHLGPEMQEMIAFEDDRSRIQRHLQEVSALLLRKRDALGVTQWQCRMTHLARLDAYAQQKQYPINMLHHERRPYFRDHLGTLCAVGFLMWQDGQHALVNQIVRDDNYAYLFDLAKKYPQIAQWAAVNGFTINELALIQPTYQAPPPDYKPWASISSGGRINVMLNVQDKDLYVAGKFSKIGGLSVNNIARWDGQNWHKVADGVVGEVHCMIELYGKILVGGQFYLPGDPSQHNIAEFDPKTGKMTGRQPGDMGGAVLTMVHDHYIYIGGTFTKLNGKPAAYLAKSETISSADNWVYDPDLTTDAPVRSIIKAQGVLLIGGDFNRFGKDKKAGNYIAYYDSDNFKWMFGLQGTHPKVNQLAFHDNILWVGTASDSVNTPLVHSLTAGLWQTVEAAQTPFFSGGAICGFASYRDELFVFGKYDWQPFFGNFGSCLNTLSGSYQYVPTVIANDSITAAVVFQNKLMLGGAFTKLHNQPFERTAMIPLKTSGTGNPEDSNIHIWADYQHITIQTDESSALQFQLVDLSGRIIMNREFAARGGAELIPCADLPAGVYGYCAIQNGIRKSGKLVLGL